MYHAIEYKYCIGMKSVQFHMLHIIILFHESDLQFGVTDRHCSINRATMFFMLHAWAKNGMQNCKKIMWLGLRIQVITWHLLFKSCDLLQFSIPILAWASNLKNMVGMLEHKQCGACTWAQLSGARSHMPNYMSRSMPQVLNSPQALPADSQVSVWSPAIHGRTDKIVHR